MRWFTHRVQVFDGLTMVTVTGDVDAAVAGQLAEALRSLAEESPGDLVIDLTGVGTLSAAGVSALMALAEVMAGSGRRLRVAVGSGPVARAMRFARADDALDVYTGVERAVGGTAGTEADAERIWRLDRQVRDLRAKLESRPMIAQALGMLQERYGLDGPDAAFRRLSECSQRHNVKVHDLARVLVELPSPDGGAGVWLTDDLRPPAPELPFAAVGAARAVVLRAALGTALNRAGADMGDVRLVNGAGTLRTATGRGLGSAFTAFLDRADPAETAPGLAFQRAARVVVPDIATEQAIGSDSRKIHLAAGLRAAHSMPVIPERDTCVGAITLYRGRTGHSPTVAECADLDRICEQTGRWLGWRRRDTIYAALESLHHDAVTRA